MKHTLRNVLLLLIIPISYVVLLLLTNLRFVTNTTTLRMLSYYY